MKEIQFEQLPSYIIENMNARKGFLYYFGTDFNSFCMSKKDKPRIFEGEDTVVLYNLRDIYDKNYLFKITISKISRKVIFGKWLILSDTNNSITLTPNYKLNLCDIKAKYNTTYRFPYPG